MLFKNWKHVFKHINQTGPNVETISSIKCWEKLVKRPQTKIEYYLD